MNSILKVQILVVLALLQVATIGLMHRDIEGSVVSLHDIVNTVNGAAVRIGLRFPEAAVYDVKSHIQPFYHAGRPTLIIFDGCTCQLHRANQWANAAKKTGEDVVQVFPGSPETLRGIVNHQFVVGRIVTCRLSELYLTIGPSDIGHLPIGYYVDRDGTLISEQR